MILVPSSPAALRHSATVDHGGYIFPLVQDLDPSTSVALCEVHQRTDSVPFLPSMTFFSGAGASLGRQGEKGVTWKIQRLPKMELDEDLSDWPISLKIRIPTESKGIFKSPISIPIGRCLTDTEYVGGVGKGSWTLVAKQFTTGNA